MHSEATNVHEKCPAFLGADRCFPDHPSTCSPRVEGEEKQQIMVRARLGTVGGIGNGEKVFWLALLLEKC